jgi:hypothetical protein
MKSIAGIADREIEADGDENGDDVSGRSERSRPPA